MNKYISCIITVMALFAFGASVCRAQESDTSATFRNPPIAKGFDYRVANLRNFFNTYNSPLALYAEDFVLMADKYNLDYRLVPAISGVESTFGKQIPSGSYNAYGWANGNYSFESWPNSIEVVSKTLRTQYVDRGANSVPEIARIYAPPSSTWAGNVQYFINKIDPLPLSFEI